ncbi:hypothetical protein [Thioalkalivibrio nitratireducens]|nr:hypothetical protein [Thioalkalivibrio nitratireducens]
MNARSASAFSTASLENLRRRLLDLTGRNRLLDFTHGRSGNIRIIDDADSSQHRALVDAIDRRNLVIKGPPGQARRRRSPIRSLCDPRAGPKVLFVAEKLAALEVVKRRLDHAGIGDFSLELHSLRSRSAGCSMSNPGASCQPGPLSAAGGARCRHCPPREVLIIAKPPQRVRRHSASVVIASVARRHLLPSR